MEKLLKITFFFIIVVGFCYGSSGCIPSEREALLEFKNKLKDPSNRLQSWDNIGDGDCCQWYGVICSNFSGHVLELHLQSLSVNEFYDFAYAYDQSYYEYYEKSAFGGEISSSLLNLKHLRYLDLSHNDFESIPIPKFLGSLRSLRSLNLYDAQFQGIIPHELGNLSNLIYLNLSNYVQYSLRVDNFDWLSGLSLLEYIDLSFVDLSHSKPVNWLEVMNKLPSLVELHLSNCNLVHIPPLVNLNFSSLSVLDLSDNNFHESSIPNWIFGLKNLKTLNLAYNHLEGPISHHLQNMTSSLQELDLSLNEFTLIPKWILSLRNLISLNLAANQFQGPIPSELQNVSSIKELDLSSNRFNSSIPNWLYDFRYLEFLNLGSNSLSGKISNAIQNMTSLTNLDLSENVEFEGGIPESFKNLCALKSLSFLGTQLGQEMNEVLNILSGCSSNLLESLDLSGCELSGKLNNQLGNFKNLIYLNLSDNSITGSIPLALTELKSLRFLLLGHNQLGGTVPATLGGLAKLEHIDISHNLLEGVVSEMHFANLTNLGTLEGSMNQLIHLRVSSDWIPPFLYLEVLKLGGWDIGYQFPSWIRTLKFVKALDLSNSRISSTIPNWFWNSSFQFTYLNLSHNQFHGVIPDINLTSHLIDLSSNLFEGSLPRISSDMWFLDFSNNSFSGSISHFICDSMHEVNDMSVVDLGNNLLTGEIPDCWSNMRSLTSLRLSNNNFSGNIPKSIGNLIDLNFLHLWNNSLSGELPMSLQNCGYLTTLDLGKNELTGRIPSWISTSFSRMSILILGGNRFHGKIPKEICQLSSLQILDLSYNSLFGDIPICINNFTFMAIDGYVHQTFFTEFDGGDEVDAIDDATIMMKGRMVEYQSILKYVRIMDLSSNNLSGKIPNEISRLVKLQSLNLSNNFLSGYIPEDIGAMKGLEALDFSRNQLNGRIPQSMASLTFLSILNLSYNNLSGRIPTGTQLQSFPSSSFIGNGGLWGPPLTDNSTPNGSVSPSGENEKGEGDEEDEVDWGLYVSMAVGFIVGFWSILCPLFLNRRWRHSYYLFLYNLWNKIWWHFRCYRG